MWWRTGLSWTWKPLHLPGSRDGGQLGGACKQSADDCKLKPIPAATNVIWGRKFIGSGVWGLSVPKRKQATQRAHFQNKATRIGWAYWSSHLYRLDNLNKCWLNIKDGQSQGALFFNLQPSTSGAWLRQKYMVKEHDHGHPTSTAVSCHTFQGWNVFLDHICTQTHTYVFINVHRIRERMVQPETTFSGFFLWTSSACVKLCPCVMSVISKHGPVSSLSVPSVFIQTRPVRHEKMS